MDVQPFSDVSVLELSTMIAGPYAGQQLGDLGADVVKIERPGTGELARSIEPTIGGESFYYLTSNRNKRSLALDITTDEGRDVFLDLAESADVVLTNFPPSFAERYGITYDQLRERNEEIIYCAISAYGHTGPRRNDPGIDTTMQALSGSMSMTRTKGTPPQRAGVPMNDIFAAQYAVQGILTALYSRAVSGGGEFIDISLLDAAVAGLATRATYSLATEEPYPCFGQRHNYFAPEGVYEVSDGPVQLSVITDRHWQQFCDAIDYPNLAADERFSRVNDRVEYREELDDILEEHLQDWTVDELLSNLRSAEVPAAPIHNTLSVWDDPQVQARNMKRSIKHPKAGTIDVLGFPIKFENFDQSIERPPPTLGEHSAEILRSYNYSEASIRALLGNDYAED